jgi:hypothetical protein
VSYAVAMRRLDASTQSEYTKTEARLKKRNNFNGEQSISQILPLRLGGAKVRRVMWFSKRSARRENIFRNFYLSSLHRIGFAYAGPDIRSSIDHHAAQS